MEEIKEHTDDEKFLFPGLDFQQLLSNPTFKRPYANGYLMGTGENDVFIIPTNNGSALFMLNFSFTTAKRILQTLTQIVAEVEQKTGEIKLPPPINSQK